MAVPVVIDRRVAAAVAEWPDRTRLPSVGQRWPTVLTRSISHLKVGHAEGALSIKLYLVASEAFSLFA